MVAEARGRLSLDGKPFLDTVKQAGGQLESKLSKSAAEAGRSIKQAFSVAAVVAFTERIIAAADETDNMSKRLGISAESVQSLKIVANEAGLSLTDFEGAILKTGKNATDAAAGNTQMAESFAKVGLSLSDIQAMKPQELFEAVAKAMHENKGNAEVLSAAYEIIGGKSGPKLQSVLEDLGEKGFAQLNKEMIASGQIMSDDAIKNWDTLGDKIAEAGRVLQSVVGEYGSKFVTWLEDAGDAFGTLLSGADPAAVAEVSAALEELRAKQEAAAAAQLAATKQLAEERAREEAQRAKIIEMETELFGLQEKHLDPAAKLNQSRADLVRLEEQLADHFAKGGEYGEHQLQLSIEIEKKKVEINGLEKESNKAQEAKLKLVKEERAELDKIKAARLSYEAQVQQFLMAQMDDKEKLAYLEGTILEDLKDRLDRERETNGESREYWEIQGKILDVTREISGLKEKEADSAKEIKDLNIEQIEKMRELRDVFKGMSDNEIKDFIEGLVSLATELNKIPKVQSLEWLRQLSDFKLPKQFSSSQGKALGNAIRAFFEALNLAAGGPPNLAFLEDLKKIGDLKLPKQFTSGQARDIADAIKILLKGFDGINAIDAGKLQAALDLVRGLMAAGPGGRWELEVKLPEGFENGIPVDMPEGFQTSLNDISVSLAKIATMKGIIWK